MNNIEKIEEKDWKDAAAYLIKMDAETAERFNYYLSEVADYPKDPHAWELLARTVRYLAQCQREEIKP